jgi:hypothetical protein
MEAQTRFATSLIPKTALRLTHPGATPGQRGATVMPTTVVQWLTVTTVTSNRAKRVPTAVGHAIHAQAVPMACVTKVSKMLIVAGQAAIHA